MQFTPESILLAIFAGVIAGLINYLASYAKGKAEVQAATEDLRQTIKNLTETTRAVELEKAKISAATALASDQRQVIYALSAATQSLIHSMCWFAWDARARKNIIKEACDLYNIEAHKFLPEIFSQLAVLRLLDSQLHADAYLYATKLTKLDVKFGEAIILGETDNSAGVYLLMELFEGSSELQLEINNFFAEKVIFHDQEGTQRF